jgi:hypothetical protein
MAMKYDANRLEGLVGECESHIEMYHGFSDPKEAASYIKDVMPPRAEVEDELNQLNEFIEYRQSLAEKAKEEKNFEKLKSLCNGKTVGLIRLRECTKPFTSLLSIYTDAEESDKKSSGSKLLDMIKAPSPVKGFSAPRAVVAPAAAGCGAPNPVEEAEELAAIEESMDKSDPKLKELIELDEHASAFEEREFANNEFAIRKNLRITQIVHRMSSIFNEAASLQAELLRLQNDVAE